MKKSMTLWLLSLLLLSQAALADRVIQLDDGVPIIITPIRDISSADDETGALITFRFLQDCKIDGAVLIPVDTIVDGKIELAEHSKMFGKKGKLEVTFYAADLGKVKIPVRTDMVKADHLSKTTKDKVASFIPYGLGRVMNGKDAIIREGTPLTLFIDGTFKFRVFQNGRVEYLKEVK